MWLVRSRDDAFEFGRGRLPLRLQPLPPPRDPREQKVGMKSVVYIVMLLVLIIYIFSILATLFFGANDPAHFGDVARSMLTLFQVRRPRLVLMVVGRGAGGEWG